MPLDVSSYQHPVDGERRVHVVVVLPTTAAEHQIDKLVADFVRETTIRYPQAEVYYPGQKQGRLAQFVTKKFRVGRADKRGVA